MHNHLKPWKPSPAAKPSHLATRPANQTAANVAALIGATSAFASSSTTSLPDVSQLRRKYDTAETAEINVPSVHRGRTVEPESDKEQVYVGSSPPLRGRHLSPEDASLAGARSATHDISPSNTGSIDRSPSMIAARLVSASSSPVRGRSVASPPELPSPAESRSVRPPLSTSGSLSNKNIKASTWSMMNKKDHGQEQPPSLHLEKAPVLSPSHKSMITQEFKKFPPPPIQQKQSQVAPLKHSATAADVQSKSMNISSPPITVPNVKPPVPAPRKGKIMARSPLQADLTGPRSAPGLTREEVINRMADAMVASSLASTRTSSPTKGASARPGMRRSESARASYRTTPIDAPPLPTLTKSMRPMKMTLRKESPEDEEDEVKRGRRHLVRKHPNMHHEGDRKRWRDKVTETERKRYEGVFAANRGLHLRVVDTRASPSRLMDPNAESNHVANVVVRDIWDRSRLSPYLLEKIYDLVAPEEAKTLSREQFVVGLWLIDQKLKGRKLPVEVSQSIWASVRHTQGITISHH